MPEEEDDVDRRRFLVGSAAAAAAGGLYRGAPAAAAGRRIGEPEIDAIRAAAQRIKAEDMRSGGGAGLDQALRDGSSAVLYRHADVPDRLRPELWSAMGWLLSEVGFKLHDVGHDTEAYGWWATARSAAEEAGNWSLWARVAAQVARQATWLGHPDTAVAELSHALAGDRRRALTDTERAMLYDLRARAHARARNHGTAMWDVTAADAAMAAGIGDDLGDRPWVGHLTVAHHHGDVAAALMMVARDGAPDALPEAMGRMATSAEGHGPESTRSWTLSMLMLSTLDMEMGDVERGALTGSQALDVVASVRSARVKAEVQRLQAASAPHVARPDVAEVHDRCVEALAA